MKKPGNVFPKMHLAGSVHMEWKSCGRGNCRCCNGDLHGPYFTRRWRENGRLRREYVPRRRLAETLMAIEAYRFQRHELRSIIFGIKHTLDQKIGIRL